MIHITLIPFDKMNLIEKGKYLVRTKSVPKETINYLSANVWEAAGRMVIDVDNQTVTHISSQKLE